MFFEYVLLGFVSLLVVYYPSMSCVVYIIFKRCIMLCLAYAVCVLFLALVCPNAVFGFLIYCALLVVRMFLMSA